MRKLRQGGEVKSLVQGLPSSHCGNTDPNLESQLPEARMSGEVDVPPNSLMEKK